MEWSVDGLENWDKTRWLIQSRPLLWIDVASAEAGGLRAADCGLRSNPTPTATDQRSARAQRPAQTSDQPQLTRSPARSGRVEWR